MAATIRTPTQQPTPATNGSSLPANPQLKRIVYSKYRELLGSYNDKANAIIESLPAYMVKEDLGFHFDPEIIDQEDEVVYGAPPAPPPLAGGSIPAQRLSTQMPQYNFGEAPACVQNAMLTKDKKPFTYTPGGIDLSQIKSQRMAKRLARNAQIEGAGVQHQQPRPSPAQTNGNVPAGAAAAQLGATAMGMPFQVLPSGPPPPPSQQGSKATGPPPPPPPIAPLNQLAPQSNGNIVAANRKSPTPQSFEPPPIGFRPEIKIPPNPMATLKKVPPPQEKNNFWVEEYKKERSKSPMVDQPDYIQNSLNNQESKQQIQDSFGTQSRSTPVSSPLPQQNRSHQEYYTQRAASPPRTPIQQFEQQRNFENVGQSSYAPTLQRHTSQYQPSIQQQTPVQQQQQTPPVQHQPTVQLPQYQSPTLPQSQAHNHQQQQSVPWRVQRQIPTGVQSNDSRSKEVTSPGLSDSPKPQYLQQSQQIPVYVNAQQAVSPASEATSPQRPPQSQQKNSQVGSLYIPPVSGQQQTSTTYAESPNARSQRQVRQAPAGRWGSPQTQPQSVDSSNLNRIKSPPPAPSNGFPAHPGTGLKLQINKTPPSANAKERIIPIQMEHTPTPTRAPSSAGFGPQPFYNTNSPQYTSVSPQSSTPGAQNHGPGSTGYVIRSPNQFVDQGYNNYPEGQDPNRVTSPPLQSTPSGKMERIIPINLESSSPDGPLSANNVRGPISKQPLVIQNDPRNQNAWAGGNTTPNQSKSFRILQKITDTVDDSPSKNKFSDSETSDPEPQLQKPTYARQMGPGQLTSPTEQMRRMQLNNEQNFANRNRNQGTPPVMKQPQPNKYVTQRPVFTNEEQQQYVHPSEQQVPEPKKYTGSAIPSRSFKILQAMTTPENAAEMEDSEETNKSMTECPCQFPVPPPYLCSYPYLPPCCMPHPMPPPIGADICNWQYPGSFHDHAQYCPPHSYPHQYQHPSSQPPFPPPHYPPYPYFYYFYPPTEYDAPSCMHCRTSKSVCRGSSIGKELPNIVITPSAEDSSGQRKREGSVGEIGSRKYYEIPLLSEVDLNISCEDNKPYDGERDKEFDSAPSPIKSESDNNNTSSDIGDFSPSSTDQEAVSTPAQYHNVGLKSIKSVANVHVYNKKILPLTDSSDEDWAQSDDESLSQDKESSDKIIDSEADESPSIFENNDHHNNFCEEEDDVIIMDGLSVICEENESENASPRPSSQMSASASESTLTNDITEKSENDNIDQEDHDNTNSVTVRLPLMFSFSRSSNDENITTVKVGNSEIEDQRIELNNMAETKDQSDSSSECDVSVTISLSPSAKSLEQNSNLPNKSKWESTYDSDSEDVSVSFSLPMRNKFMNQTWTGDITNNIATADEPAPQIDAKPDSDTLKRKKRVSESEKVSNLFHNSTESTIDYSENADQTQADQTKARKQSGGDSTEEIDFWATLESTKKEAQLLFEMTMDYWGKTNSEPKTEDPKSEQIVDDDVDDFWNTIRIKNSDDKPAEEKTKANADSSPKDEPKIKTAKIKKRKKKIIKSVERPPEPEPNLSTIKLSNAKNKSKIVETTIKMIQDNIRRPSLVKTYSKEVDTGNFVATIRSSFDQDDCENDQPTAVNSEPEVDDNVRKISSTVTDTPKNLVNTRKFNTDNLKKEKIDFCIQVLEREYSVQVVSAIKPICMKAVLSETDIEPTLSGNDCLIQSKEREEKSSRKYPGSEPEKIEIVKDNVDHEYFEQDAGKLPKSKLSKKKTRKKKKVDETEEESISSEVHNDRNNTFSRIVFTLEDKEDCPTEMPEEFNEPPNLKLFEEEPVEDVHEMNNQQESIEEYMTDPEQLMKESEEVDFWAIIDSMKANESKSPESAWDVMRSPPNDIEVCADSELPQALVTSESNSNEPNIFEDADSHITFSTRNKNEEGEVPHLIGNIDPIPEKIAETNAIPESSKSIGLEDHQDIDIWAERDEITPSLPESSKSLSETSNYEPSTKEQELQKFLIRPKRKTSTIIDLQTYDDPDIGVINFESVSIRSSEFEQPTGRWHEVSSSKQTTFGKAKVTGENLINDEEIGNNCAQKDAVVDFWITQKKIGATNSNHNEVTEEIDFWAEIKGSSEENDDPPYKPAFDECEIRRNNYKNAVAFFANTVNMDKEENSPVIDTKLDTQSQENTPQPLNLETTDTNNNLEQNQLDEEPDIMPNGSDKIVIKQEENTALNLFPPVDSVTDNQLENILPQEESITNEDLSSIQPISVNGEISMSVKERVHVFENISAESTIPKSQNALLVDCTTSPRSILSRNSSQRSESEMEEEDSGVTDMNKPLSETDTESDNFPELRKMTRYQRASTHSRLFKLLQDECDVIEEEPHTENRTTHDEVVTFKPRKKIVHNVSITRRQNPNCIQDAESLAQRRERLSLPLHKNSSIDADNLSSPNSPASPICGQPSQPVSDKLVNELVQSLLLKKSCSNLKNLPMKKLQEAAKKVLEEEMDSLSNTSIDSTPALTPQEFKNQSYSEYYNTWDSKKNQNSSTDGSFEILPSNTFKSLQEETSISKRRTPTVRCPRVLSSKSVNRDLSRVTESPEISNGNCDSPETVLGSKQSSSVGRWKKFGV